MSELVTLKDIKEELGISPQDSAYDKFLKRKNRGISAFIESYCDRVFAKGEITETFDFPDHVIILKKLPVLSVTSLKIDDVVSSKYYLEMETGRLLYQDSADDRPVVWDSSNRDAKVEITYEAGFENIPDEIQDVVLDLIKAEFLKRKGDPTLDVKFESIPNSVSSSYFDAARLHPIFGRYVEILDTFRINSFVG